MARSGDVARNFAAGSLPQYVSVQISAKGKIRDVGRGRFEIEWRENDIRSAVENAVKQQIGAGYNLSGAWHSIGFVMNFSEAR